MLPGARAVSGDPNTGVQAAIVGRHVVNLFMGSGAGWQRMPGMGIG